MDKTKKNIRKILVANRGEIAVRVMRSCRELGIPTVAVYSDADRTALHVRYATEAFHIGPASAKESYLNIDKIIEVCKASGVDAVHPGYGFLSENAQFVRAVQEAGLIFIGPQPESMEKMGSKTAARAFMQAAGVPVVPGNAEAIKSPEAGLKLAEEMGFPVMLKAAHGGGGKGMRKVVAAKDFVSAFNGAQSESRNSFSSDEIYIEKYLDKPRHIEIQVMADVFGKTVAFAERECSVQRRHQKIIEESPSSFIDEHTREQMKKTACQAAKAVDYVGAGTIEFLVDSQKNFYFMEMNTRLQVEHPITEMITGHDLVALQIAVAQNEPLDIDDDQPAHGWAIEARVCAEDPDNNFLPTPGTITHLRQSGGPYVRTDTGLYSGSTVPMEYDPMIAKVVAWAQTRDGAIKRLDRALSELTIKGCTTNTQFLRRLLAFAPFVSGDYDTSIVDLFQKNTPIWCTDEHKLVAIIGTALLNFEHDQHMRSQVRKPDAGEAGTVSRWRAAKAPFNS